MGPNIPDKPVPREIRALLSDERPILRETQRAVTPFGGVAVFLSFIDKISLVEKVRQHMPIHWKSPNHIDPTAIFTAFLMAVLVGVRRCAHASLLRGDRPCTRCWAWSGFPTDAPSATCFESSVRAISSACSSHSPKGSCSVCHHAGGYTLDLIDGLRALRKRRLAQGHNPRKHGRPSHHPLLACCAKTTSSSTAGCAAATASSRGVE
jgi:hypothetical protein